MANLEKLESSFRNALSLPAATDFSKIRYGETAGWDSVAHMALVAEIEHTFDVMFSTEEVIDMSSFTKAQEILGTNHAIDFSS